LPPQARYGNLRQARDRTILTRMEDTLRTPALLALEEGSVFRGFAIGAIGVTVGEVVFNTAMTGYQEMLTDPSYCQQIITLTHPHIGNVGINPQDAESRQIFAAGLVIRDLSKAVSNWRATQSLTEYLQTHNTISIAGIDTRRLTRILREKGAQRGCIMAGDIDETRAIALAKDFKGLNDLDLAKVVSCEQAYQWERPTWHNINVPVRQQPAKQYKVVAYDFGVKFNTLSMLVDRGCNLIVVPATTSAEKVLAMNPQGIFLSNGPGDPAACDYAITAIQQLLTSDIPLFGICLGHQLLALAVGAKTVKMKFGHHGANHPVKDLHSNQVFITSQNHGFAVDEATLPTHVVATHRSLFDGSLQGIALKNKPAFSFQGHPEASPGPHDSGGLFDKFVGLMRDQHL